MHASPNVSLARPSLLAAALLVGGLSLTALASHRDATAAPRTSTQTFEITTVAATTPIVGQARELREGRPLNINEATAEDLRLLPGIGPKLALRIVEARARVGRFANLSDLDAVPGIGPKKLAQLAPLITVGHGGQSGNSQPTDNVNAK